MHRRAGRLTRPKLERVESVLVRLDKSAGPLRAPIERIPTSAALGRVVSHTIRAHRSYPPHDQSTMDGFAIRLSPSERRGVVPAKARRLVGRLAPGDDIRHLPRVGFATAVEVLTGATLPRGSDAVIRSENCRWTGNQVWSRVPGVRGQDIARAGEDFRRGSKIVDAGTRIRPWHVAALIANEVSHVRVFRTLRTGVLATGSEITPMRVSGRSRGVRDTTKPLLLGMLAELGVRGVDLGKASDREASIRTAIQHGLARCDLVITIGGSSRGGRDRVPGAIGAIRGARLIASRVPLRPGSTSSVAIVRRRPVFVLAGPPVAAFTGFVALVEPFLRSQGHLTHSNQPHILAKLSSSIPHRRGVREFVRVRIQHRTGGCVVRSAEQRGAGRLSSLTAADGLLVLEERRGSYRAGETVQVMPFDGRTGSRARSVG